ATLTPFPYTTLFRSYIIDRGVRTAVVVGDRSAIPEDLERRVRRGRAKFDREGVGFARSGVHRLRKRRSAFGAREYGLPEVGAARSEEHTSELQSREN